MDPTSSKYNHMESHVTFPSCRKLPKVSRGYSDKDFDSPTRGTPSILEKESSSLFFFFVSLSLSLGSPFTLLPLPASSSWEKRKRRILNFLGYPVQIYETFLSEWVISSEPYKTTPFLIRDEFPFLLVFDFFCILLYLIKDGGFLFYKRAVGGVGWGDRKGVLHISKFLLN